MTKPPRKIELIFELHNLGKNNNQLFAALIHSHSSRFSKLDSLAYAGIAFHRAVFLDAAPMHNTLGFAHTHRA